MAGVVYSYYLDGSQYQADPQCSFAHMLFNVWRASIEPFRQNSLYLQNYFYDLKRF